MEVKTNWLHFCERAIDKRTAKKATETVARKLPDQGSNLEPSG